MPLDFTAFDPLSFAAHGLMPLPWWGYVVVALVLTHVTIACVTIFLHRAQAHRALDLHPVVSHFFRFWLWLTTGMVTKEWVAIHRKHHAQVRDAGRPAQPADARHQDRVLAGLRALPRRGEERRRRWPSTARARPDDWIERNLYTRFSWEGVGADAGDRPDAVRPDRRRRSGRCR